MNRTQVWSTEDVAPSCRATWWRALMDCQFNGLETDLYGDGTCDGRLVVNQLSGVTIARLEATRHRVINSRSLPPDADAHLKIVAPFGGEVWVEQHDRTAHAQPGQWIIYDTGREYSVANPGAVDHLVVMVPRTMLYGIGVDVNELVARPLGDDGMAQVSLDTMRSTYTALPSMSPRLGSAAGEMVGQMVRLSLLERAGRHCEHSQQVAMQERIRGYVLRHLNDPKLSIDGIATALRCSKRLLHEAFRDSGQTVGAFILAQRVQACARDLRDPELRHWSIMQVATARGFVNASHFSRSFRQQMGTSPREWRNRTAEDSARPRA